MSRERLELDAAIKGAHPVRKNYGNGGVFYCTIVNVIVFLDVQNDEYFMAEVDDGAAAAEIIDRIVNQNNLRNFRAHSADITKSSLPDAILSKGISLSPCQIARLAQRVEYERPTKDFYSYRSDQPIRLSASEFVAFIAAVIRAKTLLKFVPLWRITKRIQDRKNSPLNITSTENHDKLVRAVNSYHHLKPLYTSVNHCLFDSLVMVEYLASQSLYVDMCFGVSTNPFLAHCWVQYGKWVLNDRLDYVVSMEPIMKI